MFLFLSVNGERHYQSIPELPHEEVQQWMDTYRNHSGKEYQVQLKYEYTETPSVQGMWHSYVNVDPTIALATFPDADLSRPFDTPKSATEHLKQMYEKQQQTQKLSPLEAEKLESTKQSSSSDQ
jgi:hypothetical protein